MTAEGFAHCQAVLKDPELGQFVFTRLAQNPAIVATGPLGQLFATKPMPGVDPPKVPVVWLRPFPVPSFYQDVVDVNLLGEISRLTPDEWAMPETAANVAKYLSGSVSTSDQSVINASGYARWVNGVPQIATQYVILITRNGKTLPFNAGRLAGKFVTPTDESSWGGAMADVKELIDSQFRAS